MFKKTLYYLSKILFLDVIAGLLYAAIVIYGLYKIIEHVPPPLVYVITAAAIIAAAIAYVLLAKIVDRFFKRTEP